MADYNLILMGVLIQLDIVFAEVSTRDVGLLLYSRGHFIIIKYNLLLRKKESLYSNSTWVELTWWRFLEMGSSGGENRWSRACYATLRDYLGIGAN